MNLFLKQIYREWLLYRREPRLLMNATLFFIMVMVFFPLTLPPDSHLLSLAAPGLIWIALLLSLLLSSEHLFQQDFALGVLEQWIISAPNLTLFIGAKMLVHWLLTLIPILLFSPLLAILFHFSFKELAFLIATLITGSPTLSALSAFAAATTLSLEHKGTFMAIILFCLSLPILIFGSSGFEAYMEGLPVLAYLAILLAISLLAITFLPFATAAVIRLKVAD